MPVPANNPFDAEMPWAGADPQPETLGTATTDYKTSLVTDDEETNVHGKFLFGDEVLCRGSTAQSAGWLNLTHPFYGGRYTSYTFVIDAIPPDPPDASSVPYDVEKCEIAGCIDGVTRYCFDDGRHVCEE